MTTTITDHKLELAEFPSVTRSTLGSILGIIWINISAISTNKIKIDLLAQFNNAKFKKVALALNYVKEQALGVKPFFKWTWRIYPLVSGIPPA